MAVRIDLEAVRGAVAPEVYRQAEEMLAAGRLGEITPVGGGAAAIVHCGRRQGLEVWAGVTAGGFSVECDCAGSEGDPELCPHGVALTIAALRDGFAWSSSATPPSQADVDPEVRRLVDVAASLPARRLAMLVAEYAATDRRLATRLLASAGRLGPMTEAELAGVRKTIDSLAGEATAGRWGLDDVVNAGRWIVDELEVLAERPASDEALRVVEHAAEQWDELSVHLCGGWDHEDAREEISGALRAVHVRMCEQAQPDPDELADRLADIMQSADAGSCLSAPDDYLPILGPDGVALLWRYAR